VQQANYDEQNQAIYC